MHLTFSNNLGCVTGKFCKVPKPDHDIYIYIYMLICHSLAKLAKH